MMLTFTKRVVLFVLFGGLMLSIGCKKDKFSEYYARPATLADPIYQQLTARGNFTVLLKLIDKAGYKQTLSAGGYWTFFAADDAAFAKYFTESGKKSVNDIDSVTARKIVTYNLVYNAYREDELYKYQAPGQATSTTPESAFKRKTAYYDFVFSENLGGKTRKIVNTNRNGSGYVDADNGNKYIPYFITAALPGMQFTSTDYNSFFTNATFSGFNVADAKVTEKDIPAENGIIHVVDRVILPLENLDQYMTSKSDYSEFKRLLNLASTYTYNASVSKRYQALFKSMDSVFVKSYSGALAFAPNNENYTASGTDAQINGYTMFIPRNQELLAYTKNLLTYYKDFESAPPAILYDFLNAHMWRSTVWPSKIKSELNASGETSTFNTSDILERKVVSNGVFYGISAVQDADVFRTLYGKPYLNPKYTLMTKALDGDGLKPIIKIPSAKYTMFLTSDLQFRNAGYDYYDDRSNWGYLKPGTTGTIDISDVTKAKVYRIVETSILSTRNGELDDLSGKGIVEAYNGDYIIYDAGKVYASGNKENNTPVTIDSSKNTVNGKVYYTKGIFTATEQPIAFHISALATSNPNSFGSFWNYLSKSPIYNPSDKSILKIALGSFYTVFIPTNAAISKAVKDGFLPGNTTTGVPNFTPTSAVDIEKVQKFIYFHIFDKNTVVTDGKKSGPYATLLKNANGDTLFINVVSPSKDNMSLRDSYNNTVNLDLNNSNNLSNRTVIHSITSYLKYNDL